MRKLKILSHLHTIPKNNHITVFLINNLLPYLTKKAEVEVVWVVHQFEKLESKSKIDPNMTILDIHDFNNAVEILEKVKPDLIFDNEHPSLTDFAFDEAGKFLGIPVILGLYKDSDVSVSKSYYVKLELLKFLKSFSTGNISKENQRSKKRRSFIFYKYGFLLRTIRATRKSIWYTIKYFFTVLKVQLYPKRPFTDLRFANTLHWIPGKYFFKPYKDAGWDMSKFVLTGNPIYDPAFNKIKEFKKKKSDDGRIRVLFLPSTNYEISFLSKKDRDYSVEGILRELKKYQNDFKITVKLHPSTHFHEQYPPLIHAIDSSIQIFKEGNILDYLEETDLVIGFKSNSSSLIYALIAKKPIILYDFFGGYSSWLLKEGLALELKEISELSQLIHRAVKSNPASKEKFDAFIEKYLYKADGHSSERLCNALFKLLESNYNPN